MAFCMKVAQGSIEITKCPYMSEEAIALLSEATAPPMKTVTVGEHKLGGETVMMRHEKTLVNRNLFAATLCTCMDDAKVEARIEGIKKVDYERIGEREMVECVFVHDGGDSAKFVELPSKAVPSSSTPRTSTPQRQLSRRSRTTSPSSTAPTRITSRQ